MKELDQPHRTALGAAFAAFLILLLLWWHVMDLADAQLYAQARTEGNDQLKLYSANLTNVVNQRIALINGFSAYISAEIADEGKYDERELNEFSRFLMATTRGVRNIALAPDGVMRYVYPYEPNKSVLGYEPAKDPRPDVPMEVQRAIDTGKVVLSRPYELIQGGIGMIARQAIFFEGGYWGLTNIVIDIPVLLEDADISIGATGLDLILLDQTGQLFYGAEAVYEKDPISTLVSLPEGEWTMVGAPSAGWKAAYAGTLNIIRGLSLAVVVMTTAIVYSLTNRQKRLRSLVDARTAELRETEAQLLLDIARREQVEREKELLLASESYQRTIAETLSEVTLSLTSHLTISPILNEILLQIKRIVPYETGNIAMLEGNKMRIGAWYGYEEGVTTEFFRSTVIQPLDIFKIDAYVIQSRQPRAIGDVSQEPEWLIVPETAWIQSYLTYPICLGDKVLGLIRLDGREKGRFSQEDIEKLRPIANAAAIALYNASLFEQAEIEIAERKKVEEQIRSLNDQLEQRVETRTAELKAINEELEAFAYSISHDLRAPVRAIAGFSQILRENYAGVLDDEGLDFLERIHQSSFKMNALIEGLLSLSRLGRRELVYEEMDLAAIAAQAYRDLTEQQDRKIEFKTMPCPPAHGDRILITTLMTNLISNAIKYTCKRPDARIEFGCQQEDGATVYFVRDNGIGFDMDYVDKLFVPFQRLEPDSGIPGTGIGLTIVNRIVQRHQGVFRVESSPGEGACFYFTLPFDHG